MLRAFRRFFYSDDPLIKIAAGFSEPEALMWQELLQNSRVGAFVKNRASLSSAHIPAPVNSFELWVKQSDLERARELLAALLDSSQLVDDGGNDAR